MNIKFTIKIISQLVFLASSLVSANSYASDPDLEILNALAKNQYINSCSEEGKENNCSFIKGIEINSLKSNDNYRYLDFNLKVLNSGNDLVKIPLEFVANQIELLGVTGKSSSANIVKSNSNISIAVENTDKKSSEFIFQVKVRIAKTLNNIEFNQLVNQIVLNPSVSRGVRYTLENNRHYVFFTDELLQAKASSPEETKKTKVMYSPSPAIMITQNINVGDEINKTTMIQTINNGYSRNIVDIDLYKDSKEYSINNETKIKEDKFLVNYIPGSISMLESKIDSKNFNVENTTPYIQMINFNIGDGWNYSITKETAEKKVLAEGEKSTQEFNKNWVLYPQEKLKVNIVKQEALPGEDIVVKKRAYTVNMEDNFKHQFVFDVETTVGQQIFINLENHNNYKIETLQNNGVDIPVKNSDYILLGTNVGQNQISFTFTEDKKWSFEFNPPNIKLLNFNKKEIAQRNFYSQVTNFQSYFLLFAGGSDIKPSVMLWGVIVGIFILSFALGKIPASLWSACQWFLVLMGSIQVGLISTFIVVGTIVWLQVKKSRIEAARTNNTLELLSTKKLYNFKQVSLMILSFLTLKILFTAVYQGLLGDGNFFIEGVRSGSNSLFFYSFEQKEIFMYWIPTYIYNGMMFIWSLWIALLLLKLAPQWWDIMTASRLFAARKVVLTEPIILPPEPEVKK